MANTEPITFFVPGIPASKGSTKSMRHAATGKIITMSTCKTLPAWQATVRLIADRHWPHNPSRGPMSATAEFWLPRPKSHYGTGRNAGKLKPNAPTWAPVTPDGDKMERAMWDGLTGVVFENDRQVVRWHGTKVYGDRPGVTITVMGL